MPNETPSPTPTRNPLRPLPSPQIDPAKAVFVEVDPADLKWAITALKDCARTYTGTRGFAVEAFRSARRLEIALMAPLAPVRASPTPAPAPTFEVA